MASVHIIIGPAPTRLRTLFGLAALLLAVAGAPSGVFAQALAQSLAQSLAPVPLERFFQQPALLDAKLSPSGRQLALTTSRGADRIGLVVIDLGAEAGAAAKAVRVASFSDADITSFDWAGENRLVFSVLDLQSGGGEDKYLAPGLYGVDADGSHLLKLIKRSFSTLLSDSSALDRSLHVNHRLLKVPLQQDGVAPDEVVIGELMVKAGALESVLPMWLNTRTGRTRPMQLDAPEYAVEWLFDSAGQARVATSRLKGRQAFHWRGPGETQWRQLAEAALLKFPFSPAAVDDAGNLFVIHSPPGGNETVLARFDFTLGKPMSPPQVLAPGFSFSGALLLDKPGAKALGVRIDTDGEQTIWFDAAMKEMQALANARFPEHVNRLSCRRCGAADMVVLVRSYADRDPGSLWLYAAATQRWQAIGKILDGIDPQRMATVELQRIKARDGRDLPVWLTLPAGMKPGQPAPAVVLVHGGPWVRSGHWRWQPMEQFLASRGYLVISPEFRGSTGYGHAHYKAGWKQWGQTMQDDVADALLWAQKTGLASQQACISGASYGGYSTLMGLIRHPELYRCGIAWAAVTDPLLYLKGNWWVDDDLSSEGRQHTLPELVGDADKDAAMLTANSPLAQAKRIQAPLLLAFGEVDRRVPIAHGERLRDALSAAGHPPEWVSYANEAHGWRKPATQIDFARRVEQFLGRHLKADGP